MSQTDHKLVSFEQLQQLRENYKQQGLTVVFTNGCFDLLHIGHLHTFESAKSMGDILIVGVNSDASVKRLNKGPSRPLVPEAARARLLAGIEAIDHVVIFTEDTPVAALEQLQPHIHVKGGDYKAEDLPETEVLKHWGGEVKIVPFLPGFSTTALEQKLQS